MGTKAKADIAERNFKNNEFPLDFDVYFSFFSVHEGKETASVFSSTWTLTSFLGIIV